MNHNSKAFTLVELLAVMIVLSIIMVIAIPNVIATLDKQKKETYIADAQKFVSNVQVEMRANDNISWPDATNPITIIYLTDIDNGELENDPEGNPYSKTKSFVAITKELVGADYEMVYRVFLVGINVANPSVNRGIPLVKYSDLTGDLATSYVQNNITTYDTTLAAATAVMSPTPITIDHVNIYH